MIKHQIQFFSIALASLVGVFGEMHAKVHHHNENGSCDKQIQIIRQCDIPFTVKKSGKYCLAEDIRYKGEEAAIKIVANDVRLDMKDHIIDLSGRGGSGIFIDRNASGIEIGNGAIKNAGSPGAVNSVPPFTPEFMAQIAAARNIPELQRVFFEGLPYFSPLAANPSKGVGIFVSQGVSNVNIDQMIFSKCFVGVAGFGAVKNIVIDGCQGYDNGFDFSSVPQVDVPVTRGGFIIFFNGKNTLSSSNIHIRNCIASSEIGQYGIALFNVSGSTISNCSSTCQKGDLSELGVGFAEINCFGAFNCLNPSTTNCYAVGGSDGFNYLFSSNVLIKDCQAYDYTDQGIDLDVTHFARAINCVGSTSLPRSGGEPLSNKRIGISLISSDNAVIENCVASNNNNTDPLSGTSGIIVELSYNCVVKDCVSYSNLNGILIQSAQNCKFENNIVYSNTNAGIAQFAGNSISPLITGEGNIFHGNESFNNCSNSVSPCDFSGDVPVPNVVNETVNGTNPVAPYVNIAPNG